MLILLPPSEGKTPAPDHREPVDFSVLHHPNLNEARRQVLDVLGQISVQDDALDILKVGKSLVAEVERNTRLLDEPAGDASDIYSGVLYEALDYTSLGKTQKELADEHILIISALWGIVRLDDVIPAYRLSMGTKLGELGALANFWRPYLEAEIDVDDQLILDCRSAPYQKALPTPRAQTYEVKAMSVAPDGSRKVISHMAKHYRGLITRWILTHQLADTNDVNKLAQALNKDFDVELIPATTRKAGTITVLISAS